MITLEGIKNICKQTQKEVKHYLDTITAEEIAAFSIATVSVAVFLYGIKKARETEPMVYYVTYDETTKSYTFTPVEEDNKE